MKRRIATLVLLLNFCAAVIAAEPTVGPKAIATLLQKSSSPLISFRFLWQTGAASDPEGKEGLAALTASMLAKGGTRTLAYEQIVEAMYPMATSFEAQVDKEMTVFIGTAHQETLDRYYALISQMLLDPGFRDDDFERLKTETINFLKVSLRQNNDEELGKEQLYNIIYRQHPYGHHNVGRISTLEKLTVDDLRNFYRDQYRQGNLVIGIAGNVPSEFEQRLRNDFARLPAGSPAKPALASPKLPAGLQIEIVKRETRSTAISLGFPIPVKRGDPDWPALALAASYLGQHRSQNGVLFQRLREARGLNYGDYAYIEYFPRGMFQFEPDPNLARQQQIFQIWIRPVEPQHGHFALRAALYEFDKLLRDGLSRGAFEATREFLGKNVNVLLQTADARLGYALDSQFYGMGPFDTYFREALRRLSVEDVNRAIQRHLKSDTMRIVIVTKDAEALRNEILSGKPSPMTYNSPKPNEILNEDKDIERFRIDLKSESLRISTVEEVFK